jgi:Cytochrome c7 and related cytochrome c
MRLILAILLLAVLPVGPGFAAQTRDTFDHLTTGFELLGQHRDLTCETCHANAVFKGTPRACGACHGIGTTIRATAKNASHILSTDRCDACHTPQAWKPAVNFDHAEARGSCSTCHNNVQAQGKGPTHIQTDLECDACHSTISWAGAVFNHAGVTTACASCHNGVQATGMPATHIPTGGAPCEACHSTTNFTTFAGTPMNHAAVAGMPCATCHEAGKSFFGVTIVTRPPAPHPATGDCSQCHGSTTSFTSDSLRPANHLPTTAPCAQCHTNPSNYAQYSATGVHIGVTECLSCHGPTVASTFANITITTTSANHIPIGSLDCNGGGCHSTQNVNPGGFNIGAASITTPTLSQTGHTTVAAAVAACQTCHESAPYQGMIASTSASAGDSRPTALDKSHPTTGDCQSCHTTLPTFAANVTAGKPANHIPTTAVCSQCHTTPGNFTTYSVTGTHQGVTTCLGCHAPTVANTFVNVTIATTSANHIPIGSLDCNGAGCHTTANLNQGGFNIGTANLNAPTLNIAGHATVAAAVAACQTCHETAPYQGMIASSATSGGDSRPTAFDKSHPTTGDCTSCHTTTPTFATNLTTAAKPANHIPTNGQCSQCHTTAGNYALYSVTGTHQGVTSCLSCHGPTVASTFVNVKITTTPGNHFPIGTLDCNGGGCHTATNVNPGGFNIGTANINGPTLNVTGHTTVAAAVAACQTCHETAPYLGMTASTATTAGDSRPSAALDSKHPTSGDCGGCHITTPTFASDVVAGTKPANHIPTTAVCTQCHTSPGNFAQYSVTGTHQGVTGCLTCHAPAVATTFANITIVSTSANHIPIGTLDCNGGGCHTATNVNPGGFNIGTANINGPTLNVTGHTTVAAAVASCQTCHESAPYQGMIQSSSTTAGDSRPTALDKFHPTSGDCSGCHTTTPTFATDVSSSTPKPANHIPTSAPCAQCHTTAGNYAAYSVTGTHQGVTGCLTCHAPAVATTFANVTIVSTSANHIPIGSLDCNGGGCHTATNVNPGGFNIGTANINGPTLNVTGHATVAAAVASCQTCHESAPYQGMVQSSSTTAGDSRPTALDKFHPTSGDCSGCHTTTPTFATDVTSSATKPANHIPTSAPCAQCHTTAGNYAAYSVTGTHQGVTGCLTCHASAVATTFANVTIVSTSANHIPIGSLDCNGSGCHTTANVNPGGFVLGAANISSPTLTVAGHTTVAAAVATCQTCHETAPYQGMVASSATTAGDSRPTAFDKSHPTGGDCGGCHTTTPTFASNVSNATKPTNHIPTNAPCTQCHTTPGNYAAYVMGPTGHTGITSNCAQCHAVGLSFANMAPPTLVEPPTGATGHIPVGSLACELCHSVTNFSTFSGTVMKHAVVRANACDSCHEYGMTWKTNSGVQLWTRPSPNHHAGQDCGGSGCHTSRDKRQVRPAAVVTRTSPTTATSTTASTTVATGAVASAKGTAAAGSATGASVGPMRAAMGAAITPAAASTASTSADAMSPAAKPADHIPTSNSCLSCHTTLAWLPVKIVDHTQVIGSCASCHNGKLAIGKPMRHIASNNACESCHTTNAWMPARFDHSAMAVAHSCSTCHNAVVAIGMPRNHVPTTQQCDTCHGTLAWLPAKLDHSGIHSGCQTCHNNTNAVGLPPGHMVLQRDCATCHTYPDWSLVAFRHSSAAYPGDHHASLSCVSCHTTNTDKIAYSYGADAGTCGGCHAKDFKAEAHPKIIKGMTYTVAELGNCSGSCHVYSDSTRTTVVKSLPGPYHRVSDAAFKH